MDLEHHYQIRRFTTQVRMIDASMVPLPFTTRCTIDSTLVLAADLSQLYRTFKFNNNLLQDAKQLYFLLVAEFSLLYV